jgi:hypothetical protein
VASRSKALVGALVSGAVAITACASIVGVDEAQLDPTFGVDAGGSTSSTSSSSTSGGPDDSGAPVDDSGADVAAPPCAGKDCPCTKSADCIDPIFSACQNGACHECSTSPDSCPADQYCQSSTLTCVPGCKGEDSCPGQHCSPLIHRCVDCVVQGDCAGTKKCTESGVCADTCGGGTTCAGGKLCCGDVCVDPKTDRFNCNACGNKCAGTSPLCCNGTCADTAVDKLNCGNCATACSTVEGSPTCSGGSCTWQCQPGYTHCSVGNTGCDTRTSDSITQCGGCAINCNTRVLNATGISCQSSACTFTSCNPGFADSDKKASNGCEAPCGALNQPCCPTGPACASADNRCDKTKNKCVACLGKHTACSTGNDLCCNGCNSSNLQCF